ncbi:MAG: hypothetical protein IKP73_05530 [Bacteroidales bacterium]|nr:hypothetical protein [Bacteroidales bacterium]
MSRWDKLIAKILSLDKGNPITIPKHEPIKVVYVKMVKNIVESENTNDEDENI